LHKSRGFSIENHDISLSRIFLCRKWHAMIFENRTPIFILQKKHVINYLQQNLNEKTISVKLNKGLCADNLDQHNWLIKRIYLFYLFCFNFFLLEFTTFLNYIFQKQKRFSHCLNKLFMKFTSVTQKLTVTLKKLRLNTIPDMWLWMLNVSDVFQVHCRRRLQQFLLKIHHARFHNVIMLIFRAIARTSPSPTSNFLQENCLVDKTKERILKSIFWIFNKVIFLVKWFLVKRSFRSNLIYSKLFW
jgi:hypothetical protein